MSHCEYATKTLPIFVVLRCNFVFFEHNFVVIGNASLKSTLGRGITRTDADIIS